MNQKFRILVSIIFLSVFVLPAINVFGEEAGKPAKIHVPKDAATFEEAYEKVADDGEIILSPGEYYIDLTLEIDRSVTVRGSTENPEDVTLWTGSIPGIVISGTNVAFHNLTFRRRVPADRLEGYQNQEKTEKNEEYLLENNTIVRVTGSAEFTNCAATCRSTCFIHSGKSAAGMFTRCKAQGWVGISVRHQASVIVTECEIAECGTIGLFVDTGNVTVTRTRFHDNPRGTSLVSGSGGFFIECEFYDNRHHVLNNSKSNPVFRKCDFRRGKEYGIWCLEVGPALFEECTMYDHDDYAVLVVMHANPTFKKCRIYNGRKPLVHCGGVITPLFEECEIYGGEEANISITQNSAPTFRKCKIYDSQLEGVLCDSKGRTRGGHAKLEDCEIYGNLVGVTVDEGGLLTVTGSTIHDNQLYGLRVLKGGKGVFHDNVFRDNNSVNTDQQWLLDENAAVDFRVKPADANADSTPRPAASENRLPPWRSLSAP